MHSEKIIVPSLMTLLGTAILLGLGWWQLERLEWKKDLLATLEAEYAKDASTVILDLNQPGLEFRRGSLQGQYDFDKQLFIGPRTYTNLPGRHVVTPFIVNDGTVILVNRGWVPNEWRFADELPEHRAAATQNGRITGLLRLPERNPFMPDNRPELDQWYYIDTLQVEQARKTGALSPYILMLEGGETEGNYPVAAATKPQLPNDHLYYAVFWFTMAFLLDLIFILRFLRK